MMCRHFFCKRTKKKHRNPYDGYVVAIFCFLIQFWTCQCRSLSTQSESTSLAVDYLMKYGYLPSSESGSSSLRTDNQLQEAVKAMQKFGNIPQTGILDESTINLMQKRMCGVPDVISTSSQRKKRFVLQGQKWPRTNLTWSIEKAAYSVDLLMVLRSQLSKAFQVWADASVLYFTEVRGRQADISVSFLHGIHGDGYPFDGEGSVLAHAFFPGDGIGGDAHFDAEEKWLPYQPTQEEDGVNFFAVAAHEIGHSVGLSHSSTPGSLMFPYYQLVDGHFKLPRDDISGIQQLYGHKGVKTTQIVTNIRPRTDPLTTTTSATVKTTTKSCRHVYGDIVNETVDSNEQLPPVACNNTSIDAVTVIRRELILFKGKYFWRVNANKTLKPDYPVQIDRFWENFPTDVQKIDAVYERPTDSHIVFFIGDQYWLFAANQLVEGYPRSLTTLELPPYVKHIDAAFVWGYNHKTYFFSGSQYWKFDELSGRVELDYPRDMKTWKNVPYDIDSAFQWLDGNTYFLKGSHFWKFDDSRMETSKEATGMISEMWFGCDQQETKKVSTQEPITDAHSSAPRWRLNTNFVTLLVMGLYWSICSNDKR